MSKKKIYVDGVSLKPPKAGRPDFVKFQLSINLAKFRPWLKEHLENGNIEDRDGYVNIDVKDPWEDGDSYNIELDTWKPDPNRSNGATPPMPAFEEDDKELGGI